MDYDTISESTETPTDWIDDLVKAFQTITASVFDTMEYSEEFFKDACERIILDDDEYDPVPIIRDNGTGIKAPTVTRLYIPP